MVLVVEIVIIVHIYIYIYVRLRSVKIWANTALNCLRRRYSDEFSIGPAPPPLLLFLFYFETPEE